MKTCLTAAFALCLALSAVAPQAHPQADSSSRSILNSAAVEYLFPEQITIPAGKSTPVALHFRVAQTLHINSHAPHDEFLIRTEFSIPDASGVKLDAVTYPQGEDITLPSDPNTKISVYTGEFTLNTRLVAAAGNHLVEAKLHYQACNTTQCLPPKTISVAFDVIGK